MANKLFVGSLSYNTKEESLQELFAEAGTVQSVAIIVDKQTGRSKGFGFVEMSSDSEAAQAIELLNGRELDGRKITVNEARPMTDRPKRQGFGGGSSNHQKRW